MTQSAIDILGASVLIVDDQELNVRVLRKMLTDAGYQRIASTMNPTEVCALHQKHRYDLILLDLQMPVMNGFEVMEGLKRIEPEGYLSVLVITGNPALKVRALKVGAKDFINKPFDTMEVLTRIHNLLEVRLLYKDAERRWVQLAHYDPLTGLPNRKLFYELLQRCLVHAEVHDGMVSLMVLDIDRFKNINDTLGHAMGDELLRQCADRLRNCLRFADTIARLGADEFGLILITHEKPDESGRVANKIRAALREPFDLGGHEVTITASIGITLYPDDSRDVDTLVRNCDTAMYRAKDSGRDTYRFYTAQMNALAMEKLETESALRKALARHEFVIHYQPKVWLDSGKLSGMEALLRWNRPGYGIVSPANFIPILEETGMIVPVGAWVIHTACKQIADWRSSGAGTHCVAVNLSGRQFLRENINVDATGTMRALGNHSHLLEFEMEAANALRDNRIDASSLEFEITESLLMSHAEKSVAILERLKLLGIHVSIDDFGTGFSSLAYLKRFPIDAIKIDRAFIRDVTVNADDAAITLAIIGIAHNLRLKVIAEGVETYEQLEFLRANHCDQVQGYFLCKPLPEFEISALLNRGDALLAAAYARHNHPGDAM